MYVWLFFFSLPTHTDSLKVDVSDGAVRLTNKAHVLYPPHTARTPALCWEVPVRICSRVRWQIGRWWMRAGSQALQMARKLLALIFGSSRTVSGGYTAIAYSASMYLHQKTHALKNTLAILHIEWATRVSWLILAAGVTVDLLCRNKNTEESPWLQRRRAAPQELKKTGKKTIEDFPLSCVKCSGYRQEKGA